MKHVKATAAFVAAFLLVTIADNYSTYYAFSTLDTIQELNPTLPKDLSNYPLTEYFKRDIPLTILLGIAFHFTWNWRPRVTENNFSSFYKKHTKKFFQKSYVPVGIIILLVIRFIGVINNLLIISKIGSPYSHLIGFAERKLSLEPRFIHVMTCGIIAVVAFNLLLYLIYRMEKQYKTA